MVYFIILVFFFFVCIYIKRLLDNFYCQAKEKHRKEYMELTFFFGRYYVGLGIYIKRCYMKLFKYFERKYMGFIFQGVQVIVINEQNQILLCERNNTVQSIGKYDIGAGGMIGFTDDFTNDINKPKHTALEELEEELNIKSNDLTKLTTLTPYNDTTCTIHVFILKVNNNIEIKSKDKTYINWFFVNKSELNKYFHDIKHDGKIMIKLLE